ncbi:MAG: NADH-quinone oxidoreductase subunit NuoH [Epsilonproteobacteria bacterium]|nr:MAG: NADH-quinone oxidoreductase subunit NuoH [Campylobacterota bacterium]RLA65731.1 MAG: NADH-quinone oxidoreductase subunit NuoH [Campylobacterota bacterium]
MTDTIVSYLAKFGPFKDLLEFLTESYGANGPTLFAFLIFLVGVIIIVTILSTIGGLGTYAERKISADMQLRMGPNRVGPYGILQFLADGVKMLMKEDIVPKDVDRLLFFIAPMLALTGVFGTLAVIPFSSGFTLTDLNVGVVYLIGISSLVGLAIFLGGYASNSKWSMLGGMRGASQIISYEIPIVLSILAVVLLSGGLSFGVITRAQGGWPHEWFIFHNPFTFIGFFVLFIGSLAETNRAPFDLPEAESELVSGYHTEFTGMRFAFFALAEYIEVFVVCGVTAALFLGGYQVPFNLGGDTIWGQLLQLGAFFSKTLALYYFVIVIRWTLPRLRVDQLMTMCWKYLIPIALFNLVGAGVWMWLFKGKSLFVLLFKSGTAAAGIH